MSYVTKMGAYGLAVAAAFAVALAVLLSVASNSTATAATVELTGTSVDAQPGDTVTIPGASTATIVDFSITGGTASGSFDSGGGQTLSCSDSTTDPARGCDIQADAGITVKLNIDADSADGYISVKRDTVLPVGGDDDTVVITVTTQPKPATLTAKAGSKTVAASDSAGDTDQTTIKATVKNDQDPSVGVAGETLTFITTLGLLDCDGDGGGTNAPSQVCQADTAAAAEGVLGEVTVDLIGGGREGNAVITVTHGTLDPATAEVTFYGAAKNLDAEAAQGSVEQGGTVAVILTVTDAAGSAVKGQEPVAAAKDDIVGPAEKSNTVSVAYGVNQLDSKGEIAIPACFAHQEVLADDVDLTADPPEVETLGSSGTNDDGKCVVMVSAPDDDDTTASVNEAATRGINTLSFELGAGSDKLSASVEIEVAGAAASIVSDAPANVDPLSDTTITITVRDDEGVLVGETAINVIKVAGDGLAEGKATAAGAKTTNGSAKFSYAAGLEGQVVFRVIAGTGGSAVRDIITLQVGVPVEDPPPAPPSLNKVPSPTGVTLVTFSGGTVAELGTVVTTACSGGGTVYATDYQGRWVSYIPAAMIAALNASFEALFPDGVPAGESLLVGNCGG